MKKIIIQGIELNTLNKIPENGERNKITILEETEIFEYFDKPHAPNEVFINAHSKEYNSLESDLAPHLRLALFKKDALVNKDEELINSLLTRIIKNTTDDKPNIIHIFSCNSGAANHHLDEIVGNIILCTYVSANKVLSNYITKHLIKEYNETQNIIEFILKNLPLLSALGFSTQYKFNDVKYSCNFDADKIKNTDLRSVAELLQLQYKKIIELPEIDKKHLNLFPEYNLPEVIEFTDAELKKALQLIFNYDIDNLTPEQITNILEAEKFNVTPAILQAIHQKNITNLELFLNYKKESFSMLLHDAIPTNNPKIISMFINDTSRISARTLELAINTKNPEIVKMFIDKTPEVSSFHLIPAIKIGKPEIVKMVFEKMKKITYNDFKLLINSDNYEVIEKISNFDSGHLATAIESGKMQAIEIVLSKMTTIKDFDLSLAKDTNNQELIDMVESYKNNHYINMDNNVEAIGVDLAI